MDASRRQCVVRGNWLYCVWVCVFVYLSSTVWYMYVCVVNTARHVLVRYARWWRCVCNARMYRYICIRHIAWRSVSDCGQNSNESCPCRSVAARCATWSHIYNRAYLCPRCDSAASARPVRPSIRRWCTNAIGTLYYYQHNILVLCYQQQTSKQSLTLCTKYSVCACMYVFLCALFICCSLVR